MVRYGRSILETLKFYPNEGLGHLADSGPCSQRRLYCAKKSVRLIMINLTLFHFVFILEIILNLHVIEKRLADCLLHVTGKFYRHGLHH